MLSTYEAISFDKRIDKGGSTYPWLVKVQTENGIDSYIVKLFTSTHIEQYNPVVNEVLASKLATEFDLLVPDPGLIEFSDSFIQILPEENRNELELKDQRIKFGSRYIEGSTTFAPDLNRNFLKRYKVESIFAFDNLIQNVDRRGGKPNILLRSNEAYLIDHELSLSTINDTLIQNFMSSDWGYNCERHIFYGYLKNLPSQSKPHCFNTFLENLRTLDVHTLDSCFDQLENVGYSTESYAWVKEYLIAIKRNSLKFVNLLRYKIS